MNVVVILGHRLNDDASMSKYLKARLNLGLKTFKNVDAEYICVSGGAPNEVAKKTEAEVMVDYLVKNNFPKEKIIIEDKSNTTMENAEFLAKVLKDKKIEKIYLCSTKYHFYRWFAPKCQDCFKKYFPGVEIVKVYK